MTQTIKAFLEADALRTQLEPDADFTVISVAAANDLAKMVEDMRLASESIIEARKLIDAVDNALADAFLYDAEARLKPYENLFEKEGGE